jgi:hypothetical protein
VGERIAYFWPRVNHLKVFGPVIAEQLRRGLAGKPLLLVPDEPLVAQRAKNRELAAALRIPEIRDQIGAGVEIATVRTAVELLAVMRRNGVAAVVSQGLRLPGSVLAEAVIPSRREGTLWCSLGYVQEELLHILQAGPSILNEWDVATTLSRAGLEFVTELLRAGGVRDLAPLARMAPIGFVELDQVRGFDRAELRRRYGLPPDRPVIYFSTAPRLRLRFAPLMPLAFYARRVPTALRGGLVRHLWARQWPEVDHLATYEEILGGLRRFADRHDALLLGKTRAKHRDPAYLARSVDLLLSDGAYFPFRTLELIALADLYVGMPTASAIEAAFVGRPMIHLLPFPPESYETPVFLPVRREFYMEKGGLWNTAGLSRFHRTYRRAEWEEFDEWSRSGHFEREADPAARLALVEKVIGFDDFNASGRFLDLVEAALCRRP